jgi:hypothetical protein
MVCSFQLRQGKYMEEIYPRMEKLVSPELGPCRVEENWDCIQLFLPNIAGKGATLEFGKRAPFYYKCPAESSTPPGKCQCLPERRPFDLHEESVQYLGEADRLHRVSGWPGLFNAKVRNRKGKGGETTVIEEGNQEISFHFCLDVANHAIVSFNIRNDKRIGCPASRACQYNPRVSYTTFRYFAYDNHSPLFSPARVD